LLTHVLFVHDDVTLHSKELSRKLTAAKKQATRSEDQLSAEEYQQQMTDLDNKNRGLKKSINKLDNDITAQQERLQLLQDELERLKNANVEETIQPKDSNIAYVKHLEFMTITRNYV